MMPTILVPDEVLTARRWGIVNSWINDRNSAERLAPAPHSPSRSARGLHPSYTQRFLFIGGPLPRISIRRLVPGPCLPVHVSRAPGARVDTYCAICPLWFYALAQYPTPTAVQHETAWGLCVFHVGRHLAFRSLLCGLRALSS